jgi:glutathionylspermidine synthase
MPIKASEWLDDVLSEYLDNSLSQYNETWERFMRKFSRFLTWRITNSNILEILPIANRSLCSHEAQIGVYWLVVMFAY